MKKVVPPRFLSKAKEILRKFARGKGFGKFPLDNIKLMLEEPHRLFKNKISKFKFSRLDGRKITRAEIHKKKAIRLKEKGDDLYD
jgi:hypothetical protein